MSWMKIEDDGIAEFIGNLTKVFEDADVLYKIAVYDGAKILADEVKKGLNGLRVDNGWGTADKPLNGVNQYTKDGLITAMGISKIQQSGGVTNVSVGFDGYDGIKSAKYPKGRPYQMLMRSVESGTSFMTKQPVIRPAVNRTRKQVEGAIDKAVKRFFDERIK